MSQINTEGPGPHHMPKEPHATLGSAAFMLAGLCLENLVKYILIKKDPSLVQSDRINRTVTTHDLRNLFTEAGIPLLSADEERVVDLAETCVVWAGKYPFPLKIKDRTGVAWHDTDFELFERLSVRLRGMI
jgi:hypothetical protein